MFRNFRSSPLVHLISFPGHGARPGRHRWEPRSERSHGCFDCFNAVKMVNFKGVFIFGSEKEFIRSQIGTVRGTWAALPSCASQGIRELEVRWGWKPCHDGDINVVGSFGDLSWRYKLLGNSILIVEKGYKPCFYFFISVFFCLGDVGINVTLSPCRIPIPILCPR